MNIQQAARNTLTVWRKRVQEQASTQTLDSRIVETKKMLLPMPHKNEEGVNLPHQHWLLDEIATGGVTGDKAHRWLGYAQGYLVHDGILSLNDVKYANLFA